VAQVKALDTAPPLVLVTWEDATLLDLDPWTPNKDHKYSPKHFVSVGFLLYEGKEGVILTSAWSVDTVASRDQIPRGMIRSIKKLKV
jgi:hypothetical protein